MLLLLRMPSTFIRVPGLQSKLNFQLQHCADTYPRKQQVIAQLLGPCP